MSRIIGEVAGLFGKLAVTTWHHNIPLANWKKKSHRYFSPNMKFQNPACIVKLLVTIIKVLLIRMNFTAQCFKSAVFLRKVVTKSVPYHVTNDVLKSRKYSNYLKDT